MSKRPKVGTCRVLSLFFSLHADQLNQGIWLKWFQIVNHNSNYSKQLKVNSLLWKVFACRGAEDVNKFKCGREKCGSPSGEPLLDAQIWRSLMGREIWNAALLKRPNALPNRLDSQKASEILWICEHFGASTHLPKPNFEIKWRPSGDLKHPKLEIWPKLHLKLFQIILKKATTTILPILN